MARKNEEVSAPVVTSLPLPSSDSVLVIDLPDGQKLLVGKMSHGSVIEVATWRGTGRPDSRTNRLMLGMSSTESEQQLAAAEQEVEMVVDKRSVRYWIWVLVQLGKKVREILILLVAKVKSLIPSKKSDGTNPKPVEAVEDDVQAWLDNIKLNSSKSSPAAKSPSKSAAAKKSTSSTSKIPKKGVKKVNSRSKA